MLSLGKQNNQIVSLAIKFINENRASFTGILKKHANDISLNSAILHLIDEIIDNFTLLAQICGFLDVSTLSDSPAFRSNKMGAV